MGGEQDDEDEEDHNYLDDFDPDEDSSNGIADQNVEGDELEFNANDDI